MKKIVSYSLWNQIEPIDHGQVYKCRPIVYNIGAIENAKMIKQMYPGWIPRFYINNTVPKNIVEQLIKYGSEVINMEGSKVPPMMWRFLTCGDKDVEYMICRDCDSRIYQREVNAVNEWISSGKTLHVMRDHPHENYKILGGMWGWKNINKLYKDIEKDILRFMINKKFKRMDDMYFLYNLWDNMIGDTIAHDSLFNYPDSQTFPNDIYYKKKEYHEHVGEAIDEYNNKINLDRDIKLFKNIDFKQFDIVTKRRLNRR